MRLTTKGRYAVTAVLDLALHSQGLASGSDPCGCDPVSLADISARQGISQAYLEQLFGKLKRGGIVQSIRGPGGGYALAREMDDINVADIIAAVGEGLDATRCGGDGDCHDGHVCLTHELWADLSMQINLFLSRISLASLVQRGDVLSVSRRLDNVGDLIDARLI